MPGPTRCMRLSGARSARRRAQPRRGSARSSAAARSRPRSSAAPSAASAPLVDRDVRRPRRRCRRRRRARPATLVRIHSSTCARPARRGPRRSRTRSRPAAAARATARSRSRGRACRPRSVSSVPASTRQSASTAACDDRARRGRRPRRARRSAGSAAGSRCAQQPRAVAGGVAQQADVAARRARASARRRRAAAAGPASSTRDDRRAVAVRAAPGRRARAARCRRTPSARPGSTRWVLASVCSPPAVSTPGSVQPGNATGRSCAPAASSSRRARTVAPARPRWRAPTVRALDRDDAAVRSHHGAPAPAASISARPAQVLGAERAGR